MSRGQRAKALIYDDWANIVDKIDVGIAPVTNKTSIMESEIEELKKEIRQLKEKQQQQRKIIIKVR